MPEGPENLKEMVLEPSGISSMEKGTTQIFVRQSTIPPKLKMAPLWTLNKEDAKQTAITLGIVCFFILYSIIFDRRIEKQEEKIVSVVYKPMDAEPLLKLMEKQPTPEPKHASTKKAKKNQESKKAPDKKMMSTKKPKLAKAPPPKAAPKPKSYKTSKATQNRFKNLFKSLSAAGAPKVIADSSTSTESLTNIREVSGKGIKTRRTPGKLGANQKNYDLSTGSGGLSSKRGATKISQEMPKGVVKGIDAKLIAKVLKGLIPQFKHCYQRELIRNKNIEGVINLRFRINATGDAKNIKVIGKRVSFSATGNSCIKKVLSLVKFPRPPSGGVADVRQPLNFSSLKG